MLCLRISEDEEYQKGDASIVAFIFGTVFFPAKCNDRLTAPFILPAIK